MDDSKTCISYLLMETVIISWKHFATTSNQIQLKTKLQAERIIKCDGGAFILNAYGLWISSIEENRR